MTHITVGSCAKPLVMSSFLKCEATAAAGAYRCLPRHTVGSRLFSVGSFQFFCKLSGFQKYQETKKMIDKLVYAPQTSKK
jgi:hypothetical protein